MTDSAEGGVIVSPCGLVASITLPKLICTSQTFVSEEIFVGFLQLMSAVALMLCEYALDPVLFTMFHLSRCHTCGYMGSLYFVP